VTAIMNIDLGERVAVIPGRGYMGVMKEGFTLINFKDRKEGEEGWVFAKYRGGGRRELRRHRTRFKIKLRLERV